MGYVCEGQHGDRNQFDTERGWRNHCAVCEVERLQRERKLVPLVADRILKGMVIALIISGLIMLGYVAEAIWSATT